MATAHWNLETKVQQLAGESQGAKNMGKKGKSIFKRRNPDALCSQARNQGSSEAREQRISSGKTNCF